MVSYLFAVTTPSSIASCNTKTKRGSAPMPRLLVRKPLILTAREDGAGRRCVSARGVDVLPRFRRDIELGIAEILERIFHLSIAIRSNVRSMLNAGFVDWRHFALAFHAKSYCMTWTGVGSGKARGKSNRVAQHTLDRDGDFAISSKAKVATSCTSSWTPFRRYCYRLSVLAARPNLLNVVLLHLPCIISTRVGVLVLLHHPVHWTSCASHPSLKIALLSSARPLVATPTLTCLAQSRVTLAGPP